MSDLTKPVLTAIGVISGTSMDGIDVSIVESDGRDAACFGPGASLSLSGGARARPAGSDRATPSARSTIR